MMEMARVNAQIRPAPQPDDFHLRGALLPGGLLPVGEGWTNDACLAHMLAAQRAGSGCLPLRLGLTSLDYDEMLLRHFSRGQSGFPPSDNTIAAQRGALRQQLLDMRRDEWRDLSDLLLSARRGSDISEIWLARIIAAGCLGSGHLWRDLGLPSRKFLHETLHWNFPSLAARNTADMRWKKFFYKQLCEQRGAYVCRAPSCDQCPTFNECFGAET